MPTECTPTLFEFEAVERRAVVAGFDGGDITSNAGALLLGQVDRGLGLMRRFAACFTDRRNPYFVEHQVETLVGQRVFGLALGYEDLNDHDVTAMRPFLLRPCTTAGTPCRRRGRAVALPDDDGATLADGVGSSHDGTERPSSGEIWDGLATD